MRSNGGALAWLILACLLTGGCAGVSIKKVGGGSTFSKSGHRGLEVDELDLPGPQPTSFEGLNRSDPSVLLTHGLASHQAGVAAARASREVAARFEMDAVVDSSMALSALASDLGGQKVDPRTPAARRLYQRSVEQTLRLTSGRRVRLDQAWVNDLNSRGVPITVRQGERIWSPERFDEFLFANDYEVQRLDHQYHIDGLGVPLIALKKFDLREIEGRQGEEKYLMPRQVYPVTAILQPNDIDAGFRLELHDPLLTRQIDFKGHREPLAADLTTPLVYHFAKSSLPILQEIGLLDPQWLEKLSGLYMLHPYEPGKIPVVFVHGLRSSPAAWMKVINDLRGDQALNERYQYWLYLYPTGTPFPVSAAKLRRGLDELRQVIDPDHLDPALDRSVLIGHSMGGLISKMMIEESGNEVWNLVGSRPFEELKAPPDKIALIRPVFFFHPHPSIKRVIFVATPHRGSELGDQFIGRLADRLIRLPNPLRVTYRLLLAQNGADFFRPEYRKGLPSSIDELRTNNALLKTLERLPVRPGVQVHSIIGQKDPSVSIEASSDGVVPYQSSHLDWAMSERVVPGDHGCQDTPETIQELRRILYLHLGKAVPNELEPARGPTKGPLHSLERSMQK